MGAILFNYALCQACAGAEPEYAARCYFEDAVLRFSEFDLPPERAPSGVIGVI